MNALICCLLATLTIWDYPVRHPRHCQLRAQFVAATREGDTETMIETCQKGVKLLPDDATWRYNLACSLAYLSDSEAAFAELENAIDLGFRDADAIAKDYDLKRLEKNPRFAELVDYARAKSRQPLLTGPMAHMPATGVFGKSLALGAHNMSWNFDVGCFVADMKLAEAAPAPSNGDLYMNRDQGHSRIDPAEFPGLTEVSLDSDGRAHGMDVNLPNTLFPYPVFGNCSRAYNGVYWRSLPRAAMTTLAAGIGSFQKLYLSNQVWVFPANADCAPIGTNGDVFASMAPYWLVTAGRSWSDLQYLRAALEASRSLTKETKAAAVSRGLLAPTVMTAIRKSLRAVTNETDYLSAKAHPSALPPSGCDVARLKALCAALRPDTLPPVVPVSIGVGKTVDVPVCPEITYGSAFSTAFVLRSADTNRVFSLFAKGADEFAFRVVNGEVAAKIEPLGPNAAKVLIDRSRMSVTQRVDVAVFGRTKNSAWGAPSYVSFAVTDPDAPYSDPFLTRLNPLPPAEK